MRSDRSAAGDRHTTRWLLARLWLLAALVRSLKHVAPIVVLVQVVHAGPRAASNQSDPADRLDALFRRPPQRFPRRPPSNCLERSLGAYRLLCRAGAQPELVIGMKRALGGRIEGHTWVVV